MRKWLWALLPLVVLGVLIGVLASRFGHNPRFIPSPLIGKPAPQFSLPRLYDPHRRIDNTDFRGKVVLFNFFASWCVACIDDAPSLNYLHRQGILIYGLDYDDTRSAAKVWLKRWGNPYEAIAFDPSGEQGANWGIWGVPETYVLDRRGYVIRKFTGPITLQVARKEVIPLVKKLEHEK
jgi:cytochrome c biogenesis protein CcmG/thiol:disulfide interchange protein DsbE